jgi:hypothetical protein
MLEVKVREQQLTLHIVHSVFAVALQAQLANLAEEIQV